MRILLFMLLVSSLTMCKSKDKIPAGETINYVVLLKEGINIKTLKKDINHKMLNSKRRSKSQNQWEIEFKKNGNKSKLIKRDLLNLDYVINALTSVEFGNLNSTKEGRVSPIKKIQRQ